jgi:hypothetical protein
MTKKKQDGPKTAIDSLISEMKATQNKLEKRTANFKKSNKNKKNKPTHKQRKGSNQNNSYHKKISITIRRIQLPRNQA